VVITFWFIIGTATASELGAEDVSLGSVVVWNLTFHQCEGSFCVTVLQWLNAIN